jgi:hypothetical protein
VIVAVSVGGYTSSLAKEWGADAFIPKQRYVSSKTTEAADILLPIIRGAIHERLVKNLPTSGLLKYSDANLALTAIVENIGEKCLTALTLQLLDLEDAVPIGISYVTAGLSGAEVLFAECGTSQLLLKVSRDLGALVRELEGRHKTRNFPGALWGRFQDSKAVPVECEGWYAIGSDFEGEAESLLDWLRTPRSWADAHRLLDELLLDDKDGLTRVYTAKIPQRNQTPSSSDQDVSPPKDQQAPNVVLWEELGLGRRARIALAVSDLDDLAQDCGHLMDYNRKIIEEYLLTGRIDDLDQKLIQPIYTGGTRTCLSHGDLHSRNILVTRRSRARLIDPANIDHLHWASDIARLCVDLLVSGIDHGKESHKWDQMPNWCEFIKTFLGSRDFVESGPDETDSSLKTALSWIRYNIYAIHRLEADEDRLEGEVLLAFAIEFLRASYRKQELPTPKRVLGLLAACHALRLSSAAFRTAYKIS